MHISKKTSNHTLECGKSGSLLLLAGELAKARRVSTQARASDFDYGRRSAPTRHLCVHGLNTGFTLKRSLITSVKHILFSKPPFT